MGVAEGSRDLASRLDRPIKGTCLGDLLLTCPDPLREDGNVWAWGFMCCDFILWPEYLQQGFYGAVYFRFMGLSFLREGPVLGQVLVRVSGWRCAGLLDLWV